MTRFWPILLIFAVAFSARAQDAGSALEELSDLDFLLEAPLPGEAAALSGAESAVVTSDLLGEPVIRVTELNPQAGFDPVAEADIPLGIKLDAALARRALRRLWDTGNYSNIQIYVRPVPGKGVEILIEVELMLRMRRLDVLGNNALDDDEVARALEYAADRTVVADPEVLRRLKMKLLDAYSARGYRETRANLRLEATDEPGGVALVVEVEEGKPEKYTRIRIPDLPETLDEGRVLRLTGLRSGMLRDREEVEKRVVELTERLADEGYRDAEVKQFRERRLQRYDIELIIPIDAGIRTRFFFEGSEHFRSDELEEVLIGDGLLSTSPDALKQGVNRLKDHLRMNGFFHARIGVSRVCIGPEGAVLRVPSSAVCPSSSSTQVLRFEVADGPSVEVARIDFTGNEYFSDKDLEGEVFAFVKEQLEGEDVFSPLNTELVDDKNLSNKRREDRPRNLGSKAPRHKRARVYMPKVYREAMDHLATIYQEQGFLGVEVADTCEIDQRESLTFEGMRFSPIEIQRKGDSEEKAGKKLQPCIFIDEDLDMFIVAVSIEEGPQTRLNEIAFEGNEVFSARTLQQIGGLSVSQPYNEYSLRESAQAIVKYYKSKGYMFADATFDKSFSNDMERAKVVIRVVEGPQVRIGRIRIEGAEATSRRLIRERLTFERGDLLTPDEIDESQQRIMELGILSSATIQMVSPEVQSEVKNIKIQVTEGNPQYLELRGGLATIEGLRGGFEYGYRNLAGWAINARVRVRANYRLFFLGNENPVIAQFEEYYRETLKNRLDLQIEHHALAGINQPHFPGTRGLLGWGIDVIHERLNEPAFSATRSTGFLRLNSTYAIGKTFRRAISLEARGGVEDSLIDVLAADRTNPQYRQYLRIPEGPSTFLVTGLKLTLDFRDHPFNPTKGMLFTVSTDFVRSLRGFDPEYTDLDGDSVNVDNYSEATIEQMIENEDLYVIDKLSELIRTEATLSMYFPFGSSGIVLALSFSGGYVFHLAKDSTTWADRYFYLGGMDTLRGFPEESLVPEDLYQQWKASLQDTSDEASILLRSSGGEAMFIARAEFRYPLAKGFMGALFGEAGNLWRDGAEMMNMIELNPLKVHLRPVAGGGLRYITPLGPLSFDLGANLNQRPHESPFAWYFSIGTAF